MALVGASCATRSRRGPGARRPYGQGQLVHLERLGGKDFFDAAVRLERIDAVVVRVRSD
ncbi:MAG: hypothetical protein KIT14_21005 [bacterium]|nr:hypothetical protein [bacterium]